MKPVSTFGQLEALAPSSARLPVDSPVAARPSDDLAFGAVDWFMYSPPTKASRYRSDPQKRMPPITTRFR
jgi:hypothetical protein